MSPVRAFKRMALLPPLTLCLLMSFITICWSEVVPDGTMGPPGALPGPDYVISHDLGHQLEANLFHSFLNFNIDANESATFTGPPGIENIIGRVTGGNFSWIDGRLVSDIGGADLYLVNPNGVVFGPNATLDVDGAFYVGTADYVRLGQDGLFSATSPESSILSVAPPSAFGFLENDPAPLSVQGSILQVPEGRTLCLVGGDIRMDDGVLLAPGGRINMTSVASTGEAAFNTSGLGVEQFKELGEIHVSHHMTGRPSSGDYIVGNIDAGGNDAGDIYIQSGRFILDGGYVFSKSSGAQSVGGGIHIHAEEDVSLENGAWIASAAFGPGDGGDVSLDTGALSMTGGSEISASGYGEGHGGGVAVRSEQSVSLENSHIISSAKGDGSGGDIFLETEDLTLTSGAQIGSSTDGSSPSGDVTVLAGSSASIRGQNDNGYRSAVFTTTRGAGHAGRIDISASDLEIDEQGAFFSTSDGDGSRGDILMNAESFRLKGAGITLASDIILDAESIMISDGSYIQSPAAPARGDIIIRGGEFQLSTDARIIGADITLDARTVDISEGAYLWSPAPGSDVSRTVKVTAEESIRISGEGQGEFPWRNKSNPLYTGIHTDVFANYDGDAGDISLSAPSITITDSGQVGARTYTDGHGGNIMVETESLRLDSGGQIAANSCGSSGYHGPAGNVSIEASESVRASGRIGELRSGVFSTTRSGAGAGQIEISTPLLSMSDSANIAVATGIFGEGDAGRIDIHVDDLRILSGAGISSASSGYGEEGLIRVTARDSIWVHDGFISSSGSRSGAAGDIKLNAAFFSLLDGSISTKTYGDRAGGDILINGDRIFMGDESQITSGSAGIGNAGNIAITASHTLKSEQSVVQTSSEVSSGGNIEINAGSAQFTRGSQVTATVKGGTGTGGNVTIHATSLVALEDSDFTARADQGFGGDITINTDVALFSKDIDLDASSNVAGQEGHVEVNSPVLDISSSLFSLPESFLAVEKLLPGPCAGRTPDEAGSLVIKRRNAVPPGPGSPK